MATPAAMMNCLAVSARMNSSESRISDKVAQICPRIGADTAAANTQAAGVPRIAEAGLAWPIELTTGAADAFPSSLSVDPTGNVFVLGTTGAATSTVWSFTESGANRTGFPVTVTLPSAPDTRLLVHAGDVTGNLYFLGESSGDLGPTKVGARDLVVTAVNPSGTSRGGYPVQFGSAGNDVPSALVIDLVGRGFATGVLDDDADTSEGRDVFVHRFPSN